MPLSCDECQPDVVCLGAHCGPPMDLVRCPETPNPSSVLSVPGHGRPCPEPSQLAHPGTKASPGKTSSLHGPRPSHPPASAFMGETGAPEKHALLLAENLVKMGGEAAGVLTFMSLS